MSFQFKSSFSESIFRQKYAAGTDDTWPNLCRRLVNDVCGDRSECGKPTVPELMSKDDQKQLIQYMIEMKFIAGGRYLYYAGKPASFFNNCFVLKAEEDSREEWARLSGAATSCLMSGGGIGVDYSILRPSGRALSKTGGISSGPIPLMHIINEIGRNVMQGGSRRSAIYGSLNWQHEDIQDFLRVKDWDEHTKKHKAKDFNWHAPLDMTNISINWDTAFIEKFCSGFTNYTIGYKSFSGELPYENVPQLWYDSVLKMCQSGEPGHSYNFWENENDTGRNAPVTGSTRVLTKSYGYMDVDQIVNIPVTLWTGFNWAENVIFKLTRKDSPLTRVRLSNGRQITCSPDHPFVVSSSKWSGGKKKTRLIKIEARQLGPKDNIQSDLPIIKDLSYNNSTAYGFGFIFGDGSLKKGKLDLSYFVENKEKPFQKTVDLLNMKLSSNQRRAYKTCDFDSKEELLDTYYKHPSFIAGWFDADGSWCRNLLRLASSDKERLYRLQESLDYLGIKSTVRLDGKSSYKPENSCYTLNVLADSFKRFKDIIPTVRVVLDIPEEFMPYRPSEVRVQSVENLDYTEDVYCCDVGLPEHSFMAEGVIIGNCTEFTSEDDSDVCNLGSINLGNISDLDELRSVVSLASKFLICGTLRAELPYEKVKQVREKNRKIGLGLMGVHEWLLQRGEKYEVTDELKSWLEVYKTESERSANEHCDRFYISRPKKYRAIAPAGTIGILASTTSGIEPLYAVAYKRRYLEGGTRWKYQYVIDSTAQRIIDEYGVSPESIETSNALTTNPEQRIRFQYEIQKYVDMAISSTINLPEWGTEFNNTSTAGTLADTLLYYCHGLRGITVYPNGSRGGQPLTEVPYAEAKQHHGIIFAEEAVCSGGICSL